jgi:hypothetical protein
MLRLLSNLIHKVPNFLSVSPHYSSLETSSAPTGFFPQGIPYFKVFHRFPAHYMYKKGEVFKFVLWRACIFSQDSTMCRPYRGAYNY